MGIPPAGKKLIDASDADTDEDGYLSEEELTALTVAQLKEVASELGYTITATKKADIINEILDQQEYKITYDLDGGTVADDNPTKYTRADEDITLNNPTKAGKVFAGWTGTDLESATETVVIETGSTGDRAYTATWTDE